MQRFSSPRTQNRHTPQRRAQPGDADAFSSAKRRALGGLGPRRDPTTSWPGTTPGPTRGEVTLHKVQVSAADAADLDLYEDLVRGGFWHVTIDEMQGVLGRRRRVVQRPSPHLAPRRWSRRGRPRCDNLGRWLEGRGDEICDVGHQMHLKAFENVGGDVVQVGSVTGREEDLGEPGPVSGEQLLLDATDRRVPAVQGDLPGHADLGAHRPSRRQGTRVPPPL